MPRKKKVEEAPVVEEVTVEAPVEEAPEVEMVWVETVDAIGRHMIQVPKTSIE